MLRLFRRTALLWVGLFFLVTSGLAAAMTGAIQVNLNGRTMALSQPPIVSHGRVLVPLRGIFEGMGATVSYDAVNHTVNVVRGAKTIQLALNSRTALVNGSPETLDVPAEAIGGRTMVPLRFVSQALGARVTWSAPTRTVTIASVMPPSTTLAPPPPSAVVPPVPLAIRPVINSISFNPTTPLQQGDTLTIHMLGTPGGTATCDVSGIQSNIPMNETSPGQYQGTLIIPRDLHGMTTATVVGHLTESGLTASLSTTQPVALNLLPPTTQTPVVSVTSPAAGESVASTFVVTGTAPPNSQIKVTAEMRYHTLFGLLSSRGRVVTATGQADDEGNFSIPINLGVTGKRQKVALRVKAISPLGQASKLYHENVIATGQ